ncbi:MAG: hypothetical protein KatS3mg013_1642 [Actinomycetota bacterium]|nr:MAG: hypothetical protein KatS3mg013_1642 [Actinomycetota bacterium]
MSREGIIDEVLIPAREGRGVRMRVGQLLDVVDVEGHQVGDLIAWCLDDPSEYLSPTHTVSCNASIRLKAGSQVFSNRRNPLFTIVRDDVERHDIIVPCCDRERYERDFGLPNHPHCLGNLHDARDRLGETRELHGEMAWNVFMHNRVTEDGAVVTDRAAHGAGSTITLEAHRDLVVLVSACPQDLTPCNDFDPTSMLLRVRERGDR